MIFFFFLYRKIALYIFRLPHQLFHLLWKLSCMSGGHLEKIGRPVVLENVSGSHKKIKKKKKKRRLLLPFSHRGRTLNTFFFYFALSIYFLKTSTRFYAFCNEIPFTTENMWCNCKLSLKSSPCEHSRIQKRYFIFSQFRLSKKNERKEKKKIKKRKTKCNHTWLISGRLKSQIKDFGMLWRCCGILMYSLDSHVRISPSPCTFVLQQGNLTTLLLSTQVHKWGPGNDCVWICQRHYDSVS